MNMFFCTSHAFVLVCLNKHGKFGVIFSNVEILKYVDTVIRKKSVGFIQLSNNRRPNFFKAELKIRDLDPDG